MATRTVKGTRYISVQAAAGLLGLSAAQVRSQVVEQGVAYTVAGGRLWLDRAHVEGWVARRAGSSVGGAVDSNHGF